MNSRIFFFISVPGHNCKKQNVEKLVDKNFTHYLKSYFKITSSLTSLTFTILYRTRILKTQSCPQSLGALAFFKSFMKYLQHLQLPGLQIYLNLFLQLYYHVKKKKPIFYIVSRLYKVSLNI